MLIQKLIQKFVNLFHKPEPEPEPPAPLKPIAQIADENGNFDILVTALGVAGLTDTFLNDGAFTVFAPTDDAFKELAEKTLGLDIDGKTNVEVATLLVDTLTAPTLKIVLEYHVKLGTHSLDELKELGTIPTLVTADGVASSFTIEGNELVDADPEVEDPEFIAGLTDIQASNGIIQVIDRVLLPIDVMEAMAQPTILDIAEGNDAFETLSRALELAGLDTVVDNRDADFTVFAPTDDAFRLLAEDLSIDVSGLSDPDVADALVTALTPELVTDVLLYHVKPGASSLDDLQDARLVDTALPGARVGIDGDELIDADPQIENPDFVVGLTDLEAANGVVQVIDRVLLPIDVAPVEDLRLIGTRKQDFLQGGSGDDRMFGGKAKDILNAGAGDDRLFGGIGHDKLIGGDGNDVMRGGIGNDHFIAGAGDDILIGGIGRDSFDFTNLEGDNTIRDFRGNDTLILSSDDFATAENALAAIQEVRNGLLLEGDEGSIYLRGARNLDENDLLIV